VRKRKKETLTFALAGGLKRKKTWWVHPINQKRNKLGTVHTLVSELRLYDRFKDYLHLNIEQFADVLGHVAPLITKEDTKWRETIS
jgi:hypothetical protein